MKTLLKTMYVVLASAWVSAPQAGSQTSPQRDSEQVLRWNRIALEAVERAKPSQHEAVRLLAYLSLAQNLVANGGASRETIGEAMTTASMRVIAAILPGQATFVQERHRELQANESEPGIRIAERVLADAQQDGFAQAWNGSVPQASYAWRSLAQPPRPPAYPAIATMHTFFVDSGQAFRVAPPPEAGSARFVDDLAEVRHHAATPTPETIRLAKFYDMSTGTLAGGFWNERAGELIRDRGDDEQQATTILATVNGAMMDALVACHDSKYTYWVPRPSQADSSIKPLIGVPNHPSYPSNHSCLSTAAAEVLAHFFPDERKRLAGIATEAGASRIYAGIHYRFDVEAGAAIGRQTAAAAVARQAEVLGRLPPAFLGRF